MGDWGFVFAGIGLSGWALERWCIGTPWVGGEWGDEGVSCMSVDCLCM